MKISENLSIYFQSAFHRGIGCYFHLESLGFLSTAFQSAFHRGIGCYSFNYFTSSSHLDFQSAFHRGIGCYPRRDTPTMQRLIFQSAFHRGIGCYRPRVENRRSDKRSRNLRLYVSCVIIAYTPLCVNGKLFMCDGFSRRRYLGGVYSDFRKCSVLPCMPAYCVKRITSLSKIGLGST